MIELADEHEPSGLIAGLLGAVADELADSRRGLLADGNECIEIRRHTDADTTLVLRLTIAFE
ncbi:hypothetical protein [Aquabacterium sp. A08]|uniref:hypothetical protein n=1 Tax=Aquabacterium sp. A08 TaxID=2718532 RepID=UPI0014247045|nr:hypothetical protein [Aquabacterium sp. A08]NIC43560.1 hypothetical protein [Aquabacterium sp. A08]